MQHEVFFLLLWSYMIDFPAVFQLLLFWKIPVVCFTFNLASFDLGLFGKESHWRMMTGTKSSVRCVNVCLRAATPSIDIRPRWFLQLTFGLYCPASTFLLNPFDGFSKDGYSSTEQRSSVQKCITGFSGNINGQLSLIAAACCFLCSWL